MPGAILIQPSPNLLLSSVAVGVVSRNNLHAWGLGDLCLGNLSGGWKTKAGRGGCLVGFPSQVWRTKNLLRKREKTTF